MPVFSYSCTIIYHYNTSNVWYTKNPFKNPMTSIPLLQPVLSLSDLKILILNPPLTINQKQPKLAPFMVFHVLVQFSRPFVARIFVHLFFLNKNKIYHNFVKVSDPMQTSGPNGFYEIESASLRFCLFVWGPPSDFAYHLAVCPVQYSADIVINVPSLCAVGHNGTHTCNIES